MKQQTHSEQLGELAFAAYRQAQQPGEAYHSWGDMTDQQRESWVRAARAVTVGNIATMHALLEDE